VERVVYWRVPIMPTGPAGGPRPLATGSIVMLVTVDEAHVDWRIIEQQLSEVDSIPVESVDLDKSVDTYGINTGLDVVSLEDINKAKRQIKSIVEEERINPSNTMSVEGFSVGFQ